MEDTQDTARTDPPRRRSLRRRVSDSDFSTTAFVASLVLFGAWVLLFRVIGVDSHTTVRELLRSSHVAGAQRTLVRSLAMEGGEHCSAQTEEVTKRSFWNASIRSIAYASCDASGSGAQVIAGLVFPSEQATREWMDANIDYLNSIAPNTVCEQGGAGQSEWADRTNMVRGAIACFVTPEGVAEIAWANFASQTGYVASSRQNSLGSVFDWWEQHARGEISPATGERILRHFYNSDIRGGLNSCHRGRSPLANTVLWCQGVHSANDPGGRADTLTLYYFATLQQLDAFYSTYTSQLHAPQEDNDLECGRVPFVASTYGEPTEGRCFEFTATYSEGGALWLLWTHDKQRIAALMSRSDESVRELGRMWNDLY